MVDLGSIGREVTARLPAQGMAVTRLGRDGHTYNIPSLARTIQRAELNDELGEVDVPILACPLTDETAGMIGEAQIARLHGSAVVINVARGSVLDQSALTRALAGQRIAGACLDVFAIEPLPADDPLWDLDNVLISSHSASRLADDNEAVVELFLSNLSRWRRDEPLMNLYDPVSGY